MKAERYSRIVVGKQLYEWFTASGIFPSIGEKVEEEPKYHPIPKEVQEAFEKEVQESTIPYPESKGIFYWSSHPEEYRDYEDLYYQIKQKNEKTLAKLTKKYFSKYLVS